MSSFDIFLIVHELTKYCGSYIDKILQPNPKDLLIRLNTQKPKGKKIIYIRNGELLYLTDIKKDSTLKPSTFVSTLRKYISNGRIKNVNQHEFDRVIKIIIEKKEGNYTLIIEFFSEGNIILLNPEGKIIIPFKRQKWAHRSIKVHDKYEYPPPQLNPFEMKKESFFDLIKNSNSDLVRTIAVNLNLGGLYAEEICYLAEIDKNKKINELTQNEFETIYTELMKFIEIFKKKQFEPIIVKKDNKIIDILPFEFKSYKNYEIEKVNNFTENLSILLTKEELKNKKKDEFENQISKLQRRLKQQEDAIKTLELKIAEKKKQGDLIYQNYTICEEILKKIKYLLKEKEKNKKIQEINQYNTVKEFEPTSNSLILYLKESNNKTLEIKLDFRKTVEENAEKAYRDSKKYKNKLEGAEKSTIKTKNDIESAKKKRKHLEKQKKPIISKKHYWFENYRWFISSDGNIVVCGRDAASNDKVVKKYLKEGDRYAHADIHGAPSCVIKKSDFKNNQINISEQTLNEACIFASCYSKAWKQFAESEAYWVLPEQVSKTPQSGEFVPRGAFIIRGKRNYCRCKLEIAVGLIKIDDNVKIMGGPIEAVKKHATRYVIIKPGLTKKNEIAHKLSNIFGINIDDLEKVLPSGESNITYMSTTKNNQKTE